MTKIRFQIGLIAVILLVVLRIAIGWHFLYEGLLKFDPLHEFSAKGFLGMAKGPTAPLYYIMLPDIDGTARLVIDPVMDANGKPTRARTFTIYEDAWGKFKAKYDYRYGSKLNDDQKAEVERIYNQYITALREFAAESETDVKAFRDSLARFGEKRAGETMLEVEHVQKRNWDSMMKYRGEADTWINELDKMGDAMVNQMLAVYNSTLSGASGQIVTRPEKAWVPNPIGNSQMSSLNRAVMLGLSAIGLCMILGFCNRLASLGGAVFLFNVWLTQFPIPGVYPPLPDMIGHFMIVSKDFVELLGCLILAAMPAGRWAGLDYFLYYYCGGKKLAQRFCLEEEDGTAANEDAAKKV